MNAGVVDLLFAIRDGSGTCGDENLLTVYVDMVGLLFLVSAEVMMPVPRRTV